MGSSHYQLGHKLALLDEMVRKNGSVECIMLGSSIVDGGFDPVVFQNSYQEVTGRDIFCFNFGIDASSAASTAAIARILVEDYEPHLLIFGTDARDYAVASDDPDSAVLLDTPWIRHRLGSFSPEGWLLDNSHFYRYRQHLSRLARFNFEGTLWSETELNFEILANGFTPLNKVSTYVHMAPDLEEDSFEIQYNTRIFSSYQMLDENLDALERITSYNQPGTRVIVVEMPVTDQLYYFFGNGEEDYKRFVFEVKDMIDRRNVLFLQTMPGVTIPYDGWADYSHLNSMGAKVFSFWLGQQVGSMEAP
jgi:hypothetical protein